MKKDMLKILGSVVALVALAHAISGEYHCSSDVDRLLPSKTQCDKYYRCFKGELYSGLCPYGTSFDERVAKCRPNKWVDCKGRTLSRISCPAEDGRYPVKGECHVYNLCKEGASRIYTCAPGTVFSTKAGKCILPIALSKSHPCSAENLYKFRCRSPQDDSLSREEGEERLGFPGVAGFGLGALFSPLIFKKKAILARPYVTPAPIAFAGAPVQYAAAAPPVQYAAAAAPVQYAAPVTLPIQPAMQIQPSMPLMPTPPPAVPTPQIQTIARPQRIDLVIERPRPVINQVVVTRTQNMVVTRTVDRTQYVDVMVEGKRPVIGNIVMNVPQPMINTIVVDKPQVVDVTMESVRPNMQTVFVEKPVIIQRPVQVDRVEKVDVVLNQQSGQPASFVVPTGGMGAQQITSGMGMMQPADGMGIQAISPVQPGGPWIGAGHQATGQVSAQAFAQASAQGSGYGADFPTDSMQAVGAMQPAAQLLQMGQYPQYAIDSMPTVSNCRIDCGPGLRSATSLVVSKPEETESRSDESLLQKFANAKSDEFFFEGEEEDRQYFQRPGCHRRCYTIINRDGQTTRICRRTCRPVMPLADDPEFEDSSDEYPNSEKSEGKIDFTVIDEATGKKVSDISLLKAFNELLLQKLRSSKVTSQTTEDLASRGQDGLGMEMKDRTTMIDDLGIKNNGVNPNALVPVTIVLGTVHGRVEDNGIFFDSFSVKSDAGKAIAIPKAQAEELEKIVKKANLEKGEFHLDAVIFTSADQVALEDATVIEAASADTPVKIAEEHTDSEKHEIALPIAMIAKASEMKQVDDEPIGIETRAYPLPPVQQARLQSLPVPSNMLGRPPLASSMPSRHGLQ